MQITRRTKQLWEIFKHPTLFPQQVVMSDGSVCEMYSLSNKKPVVKLIADSSNHPTWNPSFSEHQAILYKQERVSKFREKFGDFDQVGEYAEFIPQSKVASPDTSSIPVLDDGEKQETEPEWMKFKRAAEEKAKNAAAKKAVRKK